MRTYEHHIGASRLFSDFPTKGELFEVRGFVWNLVRKQVDEIICILELHVFQLQLGEIGTGHEESHGNVVA